MWLRLFVEVRMMHRRRTGRDVESSRGARAMKLTWDFGGNVLEEIIDKRVQDSGGWLVKPKAESWV